VEALYLDTNALDENDHHWLADHPFLRKPVPGLRTTLYHRHRYGDEWSTVLRVEHGDSTWERLLALSGGDSDGYRLTSAFVNDSQWVETNVYTSTELDERTRVQYRIDSIVRVFAYDRWLHFTERDAQTFTYYREQPGPPNVWVKRQITYAGDADGGMCGGGSSILLLEAQDTVLGARINGIILDAFNTMMDNDSATAVTLTDFLQGRRFEGEQGIAQWSITTKPLLEANDLLCFEWSQISNCGNSVSDPPMIEYLTLDLRSGTNVEFADLMDTTRLRALGRAVQAYAREQKVDNVMYGGVHDPALLTYSDTLYSAMYLQPHSIGLLLRVHDANESDWARRIREGETVGEEWMWVEVPKKRVAPFIRSEFRDRIPTE
jgi:hypothetical protein